MKHSVQKKPFEFSKAIVSATFVICLLLTIYVCYIVRLGMVTTGLIDFTPFAYLVPSWFTAFTTAIGFYYSKAKAENRIKLKKEYGVELAPQDFDADSSY